tara:strand:+ start:961 stop:2172 length:1212 start_codon:yes stop_codon:yes gene_type:complete
MFIMVERTKSWDAHRRVRAWYGGREPAEAEVIEVAEVAEGGGKVLYDSIEVSGDFADIFRNLYDEMDSLKRTPSDFRTWNSEDGFMTFFQVLLDYGPLDMRGRVSMLQRIGQFKFRSTDGPDEKKEKIADVFSDVDGEDDYSAVVRIQAKRLIEIWAPNADSLLDYIVNKPAHVGRVLADRLSPSNEKGFRVIGHAFDGVRSTQLQGLADSKTVAYEREGDIHLVTDVRETLTGWDQDSMATGGIERFTLLDALLLHELVELWLVDNEPNIDPLEAHIIASTFERYLKSSLLSVAVEDFFLNWPQPSEEEVAERHRAEMEDQLAAWSASFDDDEVPDGLDEDIDDLPLDNAAPALKKAKSKKSGEKRKDKGKLQEGKVYQTKDGRSYRIVDGHKVAVKKKNST